MLTGITTINSMITVGINLHIELFIQLNKMFGIFGTVLEVYIIIGHPMYEQKVAMEFVCPCKGGCGFISFGIFFGSTHKAFHISTFKRNLLYGDGKKYELDFAEIY